MKNPVRGLRFSLLDFQSARANTGMKIAMLGIALIPLIYGALYLMAFYDPYGKLDTLPVAVVNEDVPVQASNGTTVHAGDDLVDELKDSDALDWRFVSSADEAQEGLKKGTYYNTVIIPKDFSEKIASADSDNPQKAHLELVCNDANNYLSSILGASVMRVVTSETNYAIGKNYYVQIFDQIGDTGAQLQEAADGAGTLADGLVDAHDGSQKITDGLATAHNGSSTLQEGLTSAHDGSATITSGLVAASSGSRELATGTTNAADGSRQITDGLASAKDGSGKLANGTADAEAGSATISENLQIAADGASVLDSGLSQLVDGLTTGKTSSAMLAAGLHQLQQEGSGMLAAGAQGLVTGLDQKAEDLRKLDGGAQQVAAGSNQLSDTLSGLEPTLTGMSTKVSLLQGQLDEIEGDAQALSEGLGSTGSKLQGDAQEASSDAGKLAESLSGLSDMGSQVSALGDAADQASSLSASAQDAANTAKGAAEIAASQANAAEEALSGLTANEDGTYALTAEQLEELKGQMSAAAQSASDSAWAADGAAQAADGANQYAQSMQNGINQAAVALAGIDASALDSLKGDLEAVKGDLEAIQQGSAGLASITSKSQALIDSSQESISDASKMVNSLSGDLARVQALAAGADQVSAGVSELVLSLTADDAHMGGLYGAASQLAAGANAVDQGMLTAAENADRITSEGWGKVIDGTAKAQQEGSAPLALGLQRLSTGSNQLTSGLVTAKTGAAALNAGLGSLYAGSRTLTDGLSTARTGAATLSGGLDQLRDGSTTLTDGLADAQSGSATLTDGLGQLHDGSATLTSGLADAQDGSTRLADGLSDGVEKVRNATSGSDARATMMSEPVTLKQTNYTTVDNYGSGFAPYFIALGLWVGALVMTFLFNPLNDRLVTSGASPVVAATCGLTPMLIVGAIQAALIAFTIQVPCGIAVAHPLAYYLLTALASFTFCALVQAVIAVFGFPGKFVAVVLLMLQLTTAAGTFPIETEFPIFQAMSPYLPMTYVVHALRQAMAGADLSLVGPCVTALLAFMLTSFGITCLEAQRRRTLTMMDLHPLVNL
ncbi:MAG: YhgE/Pip domain-containing protein [Atopobiaceae bacterium]|nr:YhgE/Pip domain-containing protein [Atopobiaceae bacterium]